MNRRRISIAMATYNGAAFLREQLDSIAAQSVLPFEMVVGDDGSSDETLAILDAFAQRASFPVWVTSNPANLGFADNFLSTAARCKGDWIAFCDQDDAWYPDKIASLLKAIDAEPAATVVVHYLDRADEAGHTEGSRLPHRGPRPAMTARGQHARWDHGGCAMAFDARLVRDIDWRRRPADRFDWSLLGQPAQRQWPHDRWISLLGNLTGPVVLIDRSLGLFRRHGGTVSGSHIVTLAGQVRDAAGAADYRRGAEEARDVAQCLRALATNGGPFAACLEEGADGFERLGHLEDRREALYADDRWLARLGKWAEVVFSGGYTGDPFAAPGLRALAKDALLGVNGSARRRVGRASSMPVASQGKADKPGSDR